MLQAPSFAIYVVCAPFSYIQQNVLVVLRLVWNLYNNESNDHNASILGSTKGVSTPLFPSFIQPPDILTAGMGGASSDNGTFGINTKSDAISGSQELITQSSMQAKNVNSRGVELVVNLNTIEQGYFTSGNQTVKFKVLVNYFETQDFFQHSWHCIENLDKIPLASTG